MARIGLAIAIVFPVAAATSTSEKGCSACRSASPRTDMPLTAWKYRGNTAKQHAHVVDATLWLLQGRLLWKRLHVLVAIASPN